MSRLLRGVVRVDGADIQLTYTEQRDHSCRVTLVEEAIDEDTGEIYNRSEVTLTKGGRMDDPWVPVEALGFCDEGDHQALLFGLWIDDIDVRTDLDACLQIWPGLNFCRAIDEWQKNPWRPRGIDRPFMLEGHFARLGDVMTANRSVEVVEDKMVF